MHNYILISKIGDTHTLINGSIKASTSLSNYKFLPWFSKSILNAWRISSSPWLIFKLSLIINPHGRQSIHRVMESMNFSIAWDEKLNDPDLYTLIWETNPLMEAMNFSLFLCFFVSFFFFFYTKSNSVDSHEPHMTRPSPIGWAKVNPDWTRSWPSQLGLGNFLNHEYERTSNIFFFFNSSFNFFFFLFEWLTVALIVLMKRKDPYNNQRDNFKTS